MIHLKVEDRVATLLLDRPPVNAWDDMELDRLEIIMDEIEEVGPAVVVVRGMGRHFSAGAEIKEMVSALDAHDFERLSTFTRRIQHVFFQWEQLPMPTVAAMSGAVLGGGLELALACDLRIATSTSRIGFPEVRIGLVPAGGGTQRLTRLVGRGRALRLMLIGDPVGGAEAERLGIVEWCVNDEELELCIERIVSILLDSAGPALPAIKRCVNRYGSPDGYANEISEQRLLYATNEAQVRLRAFATKGASK